MDHGTTGPGAGRPISLLDHGYTKPGYRDKSETLGMSKKVDQNMHDKVLISQTIFGTKMPRFVHAEGPLEVAWATGGPRQRAGNLRRYVEKMPENTIRVRNF